MAAAAALERGRSPPERKEDGEDTIVVKSSGTSNHNHYWTNPSSPESSPEVEPLVTNLLSSANRPQIQLQNLESPEPEETEDVQPVVDVEVKSEHSTRPLSFKEDDRPAIPGTSEERLMQMPELRALPVCFPWLCAADGDGVVRFVDATQADLGYTQWRDGVDPASENLVGGDSRRKQIRFGCLLATRGEVQKNPCYTCANGRGKFSLCVALEYASSTTLPDHYNWLTVSQGILQRCLCELSAVRRAESMFNKATGW